MNLEDRAAISDLIALHGHYVDAGQHDRLSELLAEDVTYDTTALGGNVIVGLARLRDAAIAMGDRNPVGHHVTNIVVTEVDGDRASAISKGIGIMADGSCGSVTYHDTLIRNGHAWRITHRRVFKPGG
jgi:3-phenylpropionate/cinnamic acid dioxygenase small subunit